MNIENLIVNFFKEDPGLGGDFSYQTQLSIISIKSLLPMKSEEGVRIDYERFDQEYKLWKEYRNGANKSLLNIGDNMDSHIYWNEKDDSILARMIPIILANQDYIIIEDELIKNILYTSGNIEALLENLSIGFILHDLVLGRLDDTRDRLKDRIIKFSQIDFLAKYEDLYRFKLEDYPQNYKISFEREKIHIINLLNGLENTKYFNLGDLVGVLEGKGPEGSSGKLK